MTPKFSHLISLLIGMLLFSACAQAALQPAPLPDAILVANTISNIQPPANECLDCHTDKERLIETAKPEETVEKESSGAG